MALYTVETFLSRAAAAYRQGLLTAQAPEPVDRRCNYRHDCVDGVVRVCAIGAGLDKDDLACATLSGQSFDQILEDQIVVLMPGADAGRLTNLQHAHDQWCKARTAGSRRRAEEQFCQALGIAPRPISPTAAHEISQGVDADS